MWEAQLSDGRTNPRERNATRMGVVNFHSNNQLGVREWDLGLKRLFMPEGIHKSLIDHPSYAIILQIYTFNVLKIHQKATVATSTASFHVSCNTTLVTKFTAEKLMESMS